MSTPLHHLDNSRPYIALAPMEGLMDAHLRHLLTQQGGIDHCVTEFIRITDQIYPRHVFLRYCPELAEGGKTAAGTPVHVQLLGSNPETMAENAAKVAALGAPAIDLNFGCPAKTVNKHMGGSVLLQYPERVHDIAQAVRQAVPAHIPVSAKMRLGYLDKSQALDNAQALACANMSWLTVHARTKSEGYKPPAHWHWVAQIQENIDIPVLANGEIWNEQDAKACIEQSHTPLLMIGRGLVARPDLAACIKQQTSAQSWQQRLALVLQLAERLDHAPERLATNRMKQWLHYFSMQSNEIKDVFQTLKRAKTKAEFIQHIRAICSL